METITREAKNSNLDLEKSKPEELFQPEFAERYKQLHGDLWQRIMLLNNTIYTLEMLNNRVPLSNFLRPGIIMNLAYVFVHNYITSAILLLNGLVNEKGKDIHSVKTFKARIWKKEIWLDASMHKQFCRAVRDCKFSRLATFVNEQVQKIRDEHIAHPVLNPANAQTNIQQLRESFNSLHVLFGVLSFGKGGALSTLSSDLVRNRGKTSALDKMLDVMACKER